MDKISIILTAILMLTMIAFMAPGILAFNRGKILRNIALWLAIFLALALIYRNFGPGSPHPLFSYPAGMSNPPPPEVEKAGEKNEGTQGFAPPGE